MQKSQKKDVAIIGAGIIGLSIAAELSKRGLSVVVIEQNQIGQGCSYGNAGWMTPCFAMPLPMPGMLLKSFKWLLNPYSPLYIKPQLSLDLASWLFQFLKSMNAQQAQKSIHSLVKLSQVSLDLYEKMSHSYPQIHFEKKGLLMVSQTSEGVRSAVQELELVKDLGVKGEVLTSDGLQHKEPFLRHPLKGGVYFANEAMAEPYEVVKAYASEVQNYKQEIRENCKLIDIRYKNNEIESVLTTEGEIYADQFVFATGSWSKDFARKLELSIPVLGGKGYAMITPPLEKQPTYPIMYVEKKIAITPRKITTKEARYDNTNNGDLNSGSESFTAALTNSHEPTSSLRIAGTLELVDQDFSITQRRVENIKKGAREILFLPNELQILELWRGLRPCTPDGVPLIGRHRKIHNLVLATGHQMLGLQTGAGTGVLVSDIIESKKSFMDVEIFNPHRF